ncbi:MAG: hypothetical protein IJW82_02540 [Clostridia bacterium]|nr:hypothetical protein [Clostridia bacterium]
MNFVFFIIFSIIIFLTSLIGYNKYRSTTFYALAIGGVVNANFFHAENYPINCFGLTLGIDSIIYTLFVFCVIFMLIKEGKKSAYLLAISSIIAIVFSALMQLVSSLLSNTISIDIWKLFLTSMISSIVSIVAVFVIIEFLDRVKHKLNPYIIMIIGIVISTIISTIFYCPLNFLINGTSLNILNYLLSLFIGKFVALLCSLLTLFIINKYEALQKNDNEN